MPQQRRNMIDYNTRGTRKDKKRGNRQNERKFSQDARQRADHELWRFNTVENKGAACAFTLPVIA